MKSKVRWVIIGIRISTVLYFLLMLAFFVWASVPAAEGEPDHTIVALIMGGFLIPLMVFLEILIVHLRRRRYWAWVAGLIIGGLYLPSLFLPLGILILVGLLSEGSRIEFGVQKSTGPEGNSAVNSK